VFNSPGQRFVILDLEHRDVVLDSWVKQISDTRLIGLRKSSAWAEQQYVYFVIDFSTPVQVADFDCDLSTSSINVSYYNGKRVVLAVQAKDSTISDMVVKVGISAVSEDGAIANLEAENPEWDFEAIKQQAREQWNTEMSSIIVKGGAANDRNTFYTAMYHSLIHPNIFQDVNGDYRGTDLEVHNADNFTNYTVFSLWDTYRATHPLFTLIQQERTLDFIKTFLAMYSNGGELPMWELAGNYTGCMIGYHAIPPMVDAYQKGINGFDADLALKAMLDEAEKDELGKKDYIKYGFLPIESEHESVSKTLEYAYDDWCIAQFAKALGNQEVYQEYTIRSQAYKHLLDPATGFMRPRYNNAWKVPFDPKEVDVNFTEANSWQYSFYVPHDIFGLMRMLGGADVFEQKLDDLFSSSSETYGKDQKDISGMIGQYAHGNEPSHHMAYLYNYSGQPWKTQALVRRIMSELYTDAPDGLCGNEDCGQMSSWYVFSALGFYPVNPSNGIYDIGSPLFDTAIIQLENGKRFTIIAHNNSPENIYINNLKLNGSNYTKCFITHADIIKGGVLEFFMTEAPNKNWGVGSENVFPAQITDLLITPAPFINTPSKTFHDSVWVSMDCSDTDADIYYSFSDNEMDRRFAIYSDSILITQTTPLYIYAETKGSETSRIVKSEFIKIQGNRSIKLNAQYSQMYTAGGNDALIDMLRGNNDFRSGQWQGYQGQDVEAIVDLGALKQISTIEIGCIQDIRSWIFMPQYVEYYASNDGVHFTKLAHLTHNIPDSERESSVFRFRYELENTTARYIKVFVKYYGLLPEWHLGAGSESWVFMDEIVIE
jgi:predicted alpha-1,2-mannosidase